MLVLRTSMLRFLNPTLIAVVFCLCWNKGDASSLLMNRHIRNVRTVLWEDVNSASHPILSFKMRSQETVASVRFTDNGFLSYFIARHNTFAGICSVI